tara:strand:- start:2120 stop:2863 length:744 start_codon:yes stop_codon:yes gene_type:complete
MDKTKTISAIILVAGIGKRISDYTKKPKCLLKIKGESLLLRNIRFLRYYGIKNIIIVAGYKSHLIIREINKVKNKISIKVILNKRFKTHGNCYSLKLGLKKTIDDVIYFDGDVVYEKNILGAYLKNKFLNSILIGEGDKYDVECAKVFSYKKKVARVIEKRIFFNKKYKFIGEAIGINKIGNKEIKKFLKISNIVFKNRGNLNLNWDTFYDRFFLKSMNIKYLKSKSKKWVEIDTYDDFIKAKKIMN